MTSLQFSTHACQGLRSRYLPGYEATGLVIIILCIVCDTGIAGTTAASLQVNFHARAI